MARILVTGMSGAGKSTLLAELARRGHRTIETDLDGWTDGNGGPWDEDRMTGLLERHPEIVVCGTAENQGRFREWFDHVVLLSAPVDVLIDRVRARTENPYGSTRAQQDEIRRYVRDVEPMLRLMATVEFDGRRPVVELADAVDALI